MAAVSARSEGQDESKGQKEKLGHRRIDETGEVPLTLTYIIHPNL